ncbi:STE20/SPS1- proline-alanine-rich protein kinase [Cichlidogyrus casuarinus]|uniref:non-specific serine/threonine protein kinase n=1 Tax=Cichlidogyrus casuarinus TaxID=1844966 RepID=A0ABD2Q0N9_9PLAT
MTDTNPAATNVEVIPQWPVTRSAYEVGQLIGRGATSEVHKADCVPLAKPCAIKIINLEKCSTSASLEEINREIRSMKSLRHENIVAYYGSFVDSDELLIVMDLCQRGSLLDVIKYTQSKRDITYGAFDENTIATIMRDVLRGLAYIHENGLVHRDLKCGNLLVKDDGVIQIADFGVAAFLACQPLAATGSMDLRRFTFVGTPCWMAPEVMQQAKGYNQKADIWSIGITAIEMATGQAPYAKFPPMKVLLLTLQNDPPDIDTAASITNQYVNYGQKFRKFTKSCLIKDAAARIPAKELLQHSFIKSKAKDRDHLCRVLIRGEGDAPAVPRLSTGSDSADKLQEIKNNSTRWNFDTLGAGSNIAGDSDDEDSDDGLPNAGPAPDNSQTMSTNRTHTSANNHSPPAVPATTPCTPESEKATIPHADTAINPKVLEQAPKSKSNDQTAVTITYRITLRKRNPKQKNELQDISFFYVPGKDNTDVLSRELVDADLLDGCDLLLVAHNMSELIANPAQREKVFPLNSSTVPGQVPVESELHGYAKILIRMASTEQDQANGAVTESL